MKNSTIRFKSDDTIYTPHGLGISYSNANLTPKVARDIVAADPDAARFFEGLDEEEAEDGEPQGEKPVALSKANKDQLIALYTTELGTAPDEALTNDDLRKAIADHRAA